MRTTIRVILCVCLIRYFRTDITHDFIRIFNVKLFFPDDF